MNEYMLLYKGGDPDFHAKSHEEMAQIMARWEDWFKTLEEKGQLSNGGCPLLFSGKRITKDYMVTDIAAAELKELVSGYTIIKANSLEEAAEISKACPIFHSPIEFVEIREVMKLGS